MVDDPSRKRNSFQAHYTTDDCIVRFMVSRLQCVDGAQVLEPCAGRGHFVDALLREQNELSIDCYELEPSAADFLGAKFGDSPAVRVTRGDFIAETRRTLFEPQSYYDRVIGNPPYGAWQDFNRRAELRTDFPGIYVRETYGLFLHRCIDLLNPGGRLVFIVPDTFLHLHLHEALRRFILARTHIEEIASFPSRFFPGISFGYSNLVILTLVRTESPASSSTVTVAHGFKTAAELIEYSSGQTRSWFSVNRVAQASIVANRFAAFTHWKSDFVTATRSITSQTIGDVASVVTGFYSGDDRKYLRAAETAKRGKSYQSIDRSLIFDGVRPSIDGVGGEKCFIPIVKGGGNRFFKPTQWYVDWSRDAVKDYRIRNRKKARFQNSEFYFREGIAVPMVSSKRLTAAILDSRLFDQSIVGVFPRDETMLLYLLAFFNSSACTRLIREINPSANNSANYIKRIPFVIPTAAHKCRIDGLVKERLHLVDADPVQAAVLDDDLDNEFNVIYPFSGGEKGQRSVHTTRQKPGV